MSNRCIVDPAVLSVSGVSAPYWTPIKSPGRGFWEFNSTTVSITAPARLTGLSQTKTIKRPTNTGIADTGTTLALVSDVTCAAIYAAIPGGKYSSSVQGYIYPSNTKEANLPVVKFDVGGKEFAVMKEDLGFANAGNGYVYGGIQVTVKLCSESSSTY